MESQASLRVLERRDASMGSPPPDITFVVTQSNDKVYQHNFAASPCVANLPPHRVILQRGYPSASLAYNDAIDKAETDLIVFAHQDVYFPGSWLSDLNRALAQLERIDRGWGVLGGYGVTRMDQGVGFLYSVGLGVMGRPFDSPIPVQSLDEYFLILRKSSGLKFDPDLPNFHFYGTDICLTASEQGRRSYVISAFCVHNTSFGTGPSGFLRGYSYMRKKWAKSLPVFTPCVRITRWNGDVIRRRLIEVCFRILGRETKIIPRLEDPRAVLPFVEQLAQGVDERNL